MNVLTSFIRASQRFVRRDASLGSESSAFSVLLSGYTGRLRSISLLGTILFLCCIGGTLRAQTVTGTLLGTVNDTGGAVVSNAKITATQTDTGVIRETISNESGNYTIPDLTPGNYSVTAVNQGFKKETHENIQILTNSTQRVDFDLAVGSVTESVVVTTVPPLLQTDRADISTKIGAQEIADLPIGTNRNFQSLLNLVPGMAPAVFQHSQFFNSQSSLQTNANGIPRMGNLYQIEGIDDDERTGLLQLIIPPAEAIASVDISTNNYEAELGRAIGAVTNVTLKSGTNSFHGSAFEYIQNSAVNARSYFGPPLGHLSYNYFGGSIGGPILKNKLFFFGDFLQSIDHERVSSTLTIPDPRYYTANSAGFIDLSGTLTGTANACGFKTGQIFDPATGNGTAPSGSTCGNRTQFVNNLIPLSRVNPVSLSILQKVNAAAAQYGTLNPNAPIGNPANNYTTTLPFTKSPSSFDTKLDWAITERNHLSGRYSWQHVPVYQAPAFGSFLGGPAGGGFEANGVTNAYSLGINYDHVFSPTLLTEVRVGVAHMKNSAQPTDYGSSDATTLGIPGVNIAGQPFTSGQVGITINGGFSGTMIGYSASVPWIRAESNIDFVNNWTKVVRNHTVKFGVDLRRVRDDLLQDQTFSPRGVFNFSDVQTSEAGGSTNIANDVASFLFDLPSSAGRDLNTFFPAYRQYWFFAYAGDKWQVSPKLTLDLGVRWDFYPPATPKIPGGFSNYDPVNNQLVLAGLGNNSSNLGMTTQYKYFSPRTGFAYRPTSNTVIRGGFGISYTPFPDNTYAYNYPIRANNSYGLVGSSPYTAAVGADNVTTATFQAGFPAPAAIPIPANGIIPTNTSFLVAQNYVIIPQNYKNPYVESWNVAVQQALPGEMSLQIAYVANHGVDISGAQNINLPTTFGGGSASAPEYNCVGCPSNLHRTTSQASNAYFLGFSSNYQSLQTQLTKKMSGGLAFVSALTWGKGMGYISGDDGGLTFYAGSWRRNYAPTDFDRTINFEQSFTYILPFGRGHKYLSTGVAAQALGGWKLSGIFSAVTGTPFTVSTNGSNLNTPGTTQTGSLTGAYNVTHATGSAAHWFNPAAFSTPLGCTVSPCDAGNTGRNQFRGPGFISDNFSLFKSFNLWRETALETRIEAFQLSNTPQFANPTSNNCCTAASFGQVTGTLGSGQGSVNGVGGGRSLQASARITF
jgi:hypothetical protein